MYTNREEFIKLMEVKNDYEFIKEKGENIVFKKWNDFSLRFNYMHFSELTCLICKKPYFRRKYQTTKIHNKCQREGLALNRKGSIYAY